MTKVFDFSGFWIRQKQVCLIACYFLAVSVEHTVQQPTTSNTPIGKNKISNFYERSYQESRHTSIKLDHEYIWRVWEIISGCEVSSWLVSWVDES